MISRTRKCAKVDGKIVTEYELSLILKKYFSTGVNQEDLTAREMSDALIENGHDFGGWL